MNKHISRRTFAKNVALSAPIIILNQSHVTANERSRLHLSTNVYPWQTFYQRTGRDGRAELDTMLAEVAAAGLDGFESGAKTPDDLDQLLPLLTKHGLEMRSLYVGGTLHKPDRVDAAIANILEIAEKALAAGTRIIVTNPDPIRWGGPENKTDGQLRLQARALNRLGNELKAKGLTLAYHFHDIELRLAARELHHMMVGTDPTVVTMCLDAHWVYRGAGNSEVAVFDIAKLYAQRITELHVRQSQDDVWTETFGPGDINYSRLVQLLLDRDVRPLVVLEQAVEKASPNTMAAEEAHRKSTQYARRIFAPLA